MSCAARSAVTTIRVRADLPVTKETHDAANLASILGNYTRQGFCGLTEDERAELVDDVVGVVFSVAEETAEREDGGSEIGSEVEVVLIVTEDTCDRVAKRAAEIRERRRAERIRKFGVGA